MANWTSRWYSPNGPKTPREIADVIADFALQALKSSGNEPYNSEGVRRTIDGLRQQIDALEGLLK